MNLEQARFNMVEQQVRPWSVLDNTVLRTMEAIPRDIFTPASQKLLAYADIELPIGHGESMMYPRIEGRLLQELELGIDDECLEVGTGSGFLTACMATMSKHVDSIDIYDDFLEKASHNLAKVNISNMTLENKNALTAFNPKLSSQKNYDAIAVTGSLPEYLPLFEKILKPHGRLFVIVGSKQTMHAMKITRNGDDTFDRTSLFETEQKTLEGVEHKSSFSF